MVVEVGIAAANSCTLRYIGGFRVFGSLCPFFPPLYMAWFLPVLPFLNVRYSMSFRIHLQRLSQQLPPRAPSSTFSARRSYYYAISRERAATRLSCFWRCASARAEKRRRHHRLRLALMVNSLVRGFLGRLGGHATREERRRKQQALLVVSEGTDFITMWGVETKYTCPNRAIVFEMTVRDHGKIDVIHETFKFNLQRAEHGAFARPNQYDSVDNLSRITRAHHGEPFLAVCDWRCLF